MDKVVGLDVLILVCWVAAALSLGINGDWKSATWVIGALAVGYTIGRSHGG